MKTFGSELKASYSKYREETQKVTKNHGQEMRSPDRDLKLGLAEHAAEVL